MAKKALKKKKRQKNIIFKIALIVFAVAVSTELISLQVSIASKKTMEQKVAQQMKENEELQALIDGGMDPAYAERIAREKLGYVAPNERVFVDVNGE